MSEFNLCGVLVHAKNNLANKVQNQLDGLPGVEVHVVTEDNRLIVTVEDTEHHKCADTVSDLHNISGVLSAAVVYQHTDNEPEEESAS